MVFFNRIYQFFLFFLILACAMFWACTSGLFQVSTSQLEASQKHLVEKGHIKGWRQLDVRRLNGRLGSYSESNPLWSKDGDYLIYQIHPEKSTPSLKATQIRRKGNSLQLNSVSVDSSNLIGFLPYPYSHPLKIGTEPSTQGSNQRSRASLPVHI